MNTPSSATAFLPAFLRPERLRPHPPSPLNRDTFPPEVLVRVSTRRHMFSESNSSIVNPSKTSFNRLDKLSFQSDSNASNQSRSSADKQSTYSYSHSKTPLTTYLATMQNREAAFTFSLFNRRLGYTPARPQLKESLLYHTQHHPTIILTHLHICLQLNLWTKSNFALYRLVACSRYICITSQFT